MANVATLLVLVCKQVIFTENSILKAQRRRLRYVYTAYGQCGTRELAKPTTVSQPTARSFNRVRSHAPQPVAKEPFVFDFRVYDVYFLLLPSVPAQFFVLVWLCERALCSKRVRFATSK